MSMLNLTLDPADERPRYRQLCDALAGVIALGDLLPGARLPSERELALGLGLSRTTVVSAYRELEARGLVRGHVGRGTFVCAPLAADDTPAAWRGKIALVTQRVGDSTLRELIRPPDSGTISFAPGYSALDLFPLDQFRAAIDTALRRDPAALMLGPTEGQPALRRAVAARYRVRPEEVLITAGAQQGLDLLTRCLLDPGDAVVIDRPGYLGAIQAFRAAGARLIGWSVEAGALDELEDALLRHRPKFLYTNPTYQNPTSHTVPAAARRDLLDLAARYRLPIIEDETYQELGFAETPPPALRELDERGLVIGVNTLSKTLAPGLRLGWIIAPAAIVEQLAPLKARADIFSPGLTQLAVAELLRGRTYDEHLSRLRAEHARRQRALFDALRGEFAPGTLVTTTPRGGLYLWCRLGEGLDAAELLAAAAAVGVLFVPGEQFYIDGGGARELRLCYSGNPPERIVEGVRRLAAVLPAARSRGRDRALGHQPLV